MDHIPSAPVVAENRTRLDLELTSGQVSVLVTNHMEVHILLKAVDQSLNGGFGRPTQLGDIVWVGDAVELDQHLTSLVICEEGPTRDRGWLGGAASGAHSAGYHQG